jgi:hypothetical protein
MSEVIHERVMFPTRERVPLAVLEALLRQRFGWADCVVSPFARAARNARRAPTLIKRPALPAPTLPEELRLAG